MINEKTTYIILGCHSRNQYQAIDYLPKLMETLRQHTDNYRMIFVDDFCDDKARTMISSYAEQYPESYVIRTNKQRWFTRAYNLGLRLVRSKYAILLNLDCELGPGWLDELYSVKDEAENELKQKVGLVGSEYSADEQRRWQNITSPTTPGNPGYLTGHCILADMYALFEASANRGTPGIYLDETQVRTIHIYSDNEISERLHKIGWATVRSFKSQVGHHGGKSWHHELNRVFRLTLEEVSD